MYRRFRVTFAGFGLALGIGLLTAASSQSADDEDLKATKDAQVAILKLMDATSKGGNAKAELEAIKKQFPDELKPLMNIFKPRFKGGLGVGPPGKSDGIEMKIISLGDRRKRLSKADVDKQRDDLLKIAEVSKALAEIADMYPPKKDVDKWKKLDEDMRKGADELIAAVKQGDPKAVKTAAANLNASCTDCHGAFRDNN
jgi:hypothetical protein